MKEWRVGRFTLALSLIVLGISLLTLLFKDNYIISIVVKLWPAIIIILGIEILVSSFLSKDKMKFDVVSIVFTIIISILVMVGGLINKFGNLNGTGFWIDNFSNSKTIQQEVTLKAINELTLNNSYSGDIEVTTWDGNEAIITEITRCRYNDEKVVEDNKKNFISVTEGSNSTINTNNIRNMDFVTEKTDLKVKLPKKVKLNVKASYGNITLTAIDGIVNYEIRNGNVSIDGVNGKLFGDNRYGNTKVNNVLSDINITSKNGHIDIKDVKGNLKAINDYGRINCENISGNIDVEDKNGNIIIKNVSGTSNISSNYGSMELENLKSGAKIDSKNGKINLVYKEILNGNININSNYGNVNLNLLKGQEGIFNCETNYGSIKTSLPLNIINEDKKNKKQITGKLGDLANRFDIQCKNGDILISE
ncbi:DUF4097 and DUF4098 domain-containing protein YvlB [Clostridium cavendishii DSM 21758]|uniref:DUF4097 and DUF4098 domain-containing protein YvlB n=1 Tax=Clostridium cavendishii DSM 21758 TaxID=1121302 RepID=A0A1M6ESA0_9CLOT|nr:DUF4097 family beta strand repeat protein [Clostridium cavendishii]SHI88342.1 DUF4097 and DUF4098 domain-containing protein YvlB [Clostridium cavendishii DSM 21758]